MFKYVNSSTTLNETPLQSPSKHPRTLSSQTKSRKLVGEWKLGKTLGQGKTTVNAFLTGSSSKVKLAKNKQTGQECVVKAIRIATNTDSRKQHKRELYMIREVIISSLLLHSHILACRGSVLGEFHLYCFFDHVEGIDLVDYVTQNYRLSETLARYIILQVIGAVDYAHQNNVVHRDIKLENIRFNPVTQKAILLDFGFSTFFDTDKIDGLSSNCGSPCNVFILLLKGYASPEIYYNSCYSGPEVDIWSIGVCLYAMVKGSLPFQGHSFQLLTKSSTSPIKYPMWLSRDLKSLLKGMLEPKKEQRITMSEIYAQSWINSTRQIHRKNIPSSLLQTILSTPYEDQGEYLLTQLRERNLLKDISDDKDSLPHPPLHTVSNFSLRTETKELKHTWRWRIKHFLKNRWEKLNGSFVV